MKKLFTKDGYTVLIDDKDFEYCKQFNWHIIRKNKHLTVVRERNKGRRRLARELLNAPKGILVDHRNRNGLDNQRANLRLATYQQNAINRTKRPNTSSIYNGVSKIIRKKSGINYDTQIVINKINHHIGVFRLERHAAMAYDLTARDAFGEFASLNFPDAIYFQA